LLWLGHVLESLRGSEGKPRVVVDYDRLMLHPDVELARVARALHLEVDAAAFEDYKTNFLDGQLQHTVYRPEDLLLDNACPPIVREVYARLLDVASDQTSIDDRVLGAKLQKWLQEFEWLSTSLKLADKQLERLSFQNHALAEREGQIASLNQAVTERDGQIASLNQAVTERDGQIASLNRALAERDGQIAQICSSKSWRLTRPLRASRLIMSRVKLGLKHPVRSLWRLLPLSSRQKFRLKAAGEYRLLENNLALTLLDQDFVPLSAECVDSERVTIKTIAFYLPQFHPIPENDKNWGLGFTEWTNVSKATPQFVGHYQPRLPGELGFYDLRLKEIQRRQIELARQYGIHGFCYHHYWFNGKRVLEKPFQQVLNDPSLDLPFCLCWANENWTRRWDGGDQDIILAQNYSPEDDLAFFADILPALQDPRYIRVDGRPLLIIYRPGLLPDAAATAQRWRQAAAEAGLPGLFIVSAATFSFEDYKSIGYDGLVQFPPHNVAASDITEQQTLLKQHFSGRVYDYKQYAENAIKSIIGKKHVFPCVMMNWDNEARRPGKGHIFFGGTPQNYKTWLRRCFDFVLSNNTESERLVFINAWNEWAEGTYLEPDRRYGYAYLHATADLLRHYYKPADIDEIIAHNNARFTKRNDSALVVHLYYFDLFDELHYLIAENSKLDVFITIPIHFSREQTEKIASSLDNVYLVQVPNRGRDILPFVVMYKVIRDYGYDYLLKVHSKKSPHLPDGVLRGRRAWQELLDPKTVAQAIQTLSADATVGLIGPSNSLLSLANFDYLVNNQIRLKDCLDRLRLADTPLGFEFIAGSMFWARVDALRLLSDLSLCEDDFEEELGQLDGTLAHTIERLFSFFGERTGYRTLTVDQLA
jgi:lipopolysaccharide biosynthesis protein